MSKEGDIKIQAEAFEAAKKEFLSEPTTSGLAGLMEAHEEQTAEWLSSEKERPRLERAIRKFPTSRDDRTANHNFILGFCATYGIGIERNLDWAVLYYQRAADHGHKGAIRKLPSAKTLEREERGEWSENVISHFMSPTKEPLPQLWQSPSPKGSAVERVSRSNSAGAGLS